MPDPRQSEFRRTVPGNNVLHEFGANRGPSPGKVITVLTANDTARLADTGADVYDRDGDKIGSLGQVYLNAQNGEPEWVTVKTGLFGTKETFVPLQSASATDDRITVAYPKAQVKDAPQVDADGPLDYSEADQLYGHYGLTGAGSVDSSYEGGHAYEDRTDGTDRIGDDNAMTRSEERLVADTRTERTGKARLRKYVVTEQEQVTVPVTREEVRLEREPITDANRGAAYDGPEISEAEHEVTLHAERPVVNTETVPVERVRLGKETVTEQQQVSGEVRKEQIDFDGVDDRDRR
jgi:uncharacterized protein (TIGR02271 family)